MIRKIIYLLPLCVYWGSLFAQSPNDNPLKTKLDSVVDKAARTYLINPKRVGFSLGFIANGKTYIYNYGETAPGSGKIPTQHSIYEIGSITKTFTGLLVAHAIKEGKMELTADIRKYLPDSYPNLQYPGGGEVKVAYLLAHVAKFPNASIEDPKGDLSTSYFLEQLHNVKLDSLKEFKYAYSNLGYQLLGYMLERIYQKSFQDLVQQYINGPLKMIHTKVSFNSNDPVEVLKGFNAEKLEAKAMPFTFPGPGGLRSNLSDMLKYLKYQMDAKDAEVKFTQQITSGDIDNGAHAIQWAMGKLWNWDYYYQIDGGTPGFRTFCMFYPAYNMGFIVLSNQTDAGAAGGLYKITAAIFNELKKQGIKK
jgi:D-alanyl-D-alanine-carboxypeptidase/D-alanyl-D-alanine-endopeptidase